MTAKEKAKELIEKMVKTDHRMYYFMARECVVIAIDEILNLDSGDTVDKDYWREVRDVLSPQP